MGNLTRDEPMTTILIFGAAVRADGKPSATLQRRVETALNCARGRNDIRFIPTGAVGRHGPSEASVMASLLMNSGVSSDRILLEETGRDTLSSVRAINRMLRSEGYKGHVRVATSGYHLPRCVSLLCIFGIPAKPCATPVGPSGETAWNRLYWRLREVAAFPYDVILALWSRLTGRL